MSDGAARPLPSSSRADNALLGVPPGSCVLVDDDRLNVLAAVRTGMVGVHHVSVERTTEELVVLLGLPDAP